MTSKSPLTHAPPDHSLYPQIDPISIDTLTDHITQALLRTPELRHVWVTGEVSSANPHPSGIYFTLKDPKGKAQVLAFGKISMYTPHGKY